MGMGWEENYRQDENGTEWDISPEGRRTPAIQSHKKQVSSGFTTYDTSGGHCAFCGRLTCNGGCFR